MSRRITITLLFLISSKVIFAQNVWSSNEDSVLLHTQGRELFRTHCMSCHDVHREKVGPALASITKKRDNTWLVEFIKDSQTFIAANDPYTSFLFEQYKQTVMPSFAYLSTQEIKAILQYIEAESYVISKPPEVTGEQADYGIQTVLKGKDLFDAQCATCHALASEGFGPALASVDKRHPRQWLFNFIRNSQGVIESGDEYAIHLYRAFDERPMVEMKFLSDTDIEAILKYINYGSTLSRNELSPNTSNQERLQLSDKTTTERDNGITLPKLFAILVIVGSLVLLFTLLFRFYRILSS